MAAELGTGVTADLRVRELWRYPVKSLQGERLDVAEVGPLGLHGDRQWALFDVDTGFGLTARRVPELLFGAARVRPDGGVEVRAARRHAPPRTTARSRTGSAGGWPCGRWPRPTGGRATRARTTIWPRPWAPLPAGTRGAGPTWPSTTIPPSGCPSSPPARSAPGTARRFRANVLLDGAGEDALAGRRIGLGEARLAVGGGIDRCVMVTRPQPGGIERDTAVLKTIHRERRGELALGAVVEAGGTVRPRDALVVLD